MSDKKKFISELTTLVNGYGYDDLTGLEDDILAEYLYDAIFNLGVARKRSENRNKVIPTVDPNPFMTPCFDWTVRPSHSPSYVTTKTSTGYIK